ncbi:MAG: ABC transporter permease [Bacteroidetes bacterium]|nr:ABC transporter permease [Bacteroidota bacterium]
MAGRSLERFIALRYLRGAQGRSRSGAFLRFITFVAIGGVAVGTAALLLALMIVRGFGHEIEEKIVGFGQHVRVEHFLGDPLAGADTLAQRLAQFEGVERVAPSIIEFGLLRARNADGEVGIEGMLFWGAEEDAQPFIAEHVSAGAFSFAEDSTGHPGLVLGSRLAEQLGVSLGSIVTAFSTRSLQQRGGLGSRPRVRQFHVAGIYDTGFADFDDSFAYVDLGVARSFFGYGANEVSRIELTLDDILRSRDVANQIVVALGAPIQAVSVYEAFGHLFAWVNLQKSIIPLLISILVIVAAFNIIGTLLLLILDKTRDIGILLGMGASGKTVRRMFLWLGMFIGAAGAALGIVLALAFAFVQLKFGVIPLPPEAYYIDRAPVELSVIDFVIVPIIAVVLCTLAAYLPARTAAGIEPLRSIRFGT